MNRPTINARFVDSVGDRVFLLLRRPFESPQRGCVLFVPPFGEEMNKSRRQVTVTEQALLAEGWSVLKLDLFGTGDSDGEFADATWERWQANVETALRWADEWDAPVDALVGVRLGCLLAAQSLQAAGRSVRRAIFWQPVDSGRQFMTQFLRLKVAASLMGDSGETVDGLRARLQSGESVDVSGYTLSPALCERIDEAELSKAMNDRLGEITVLEIGRAERSDLSSATRKLIAAGERNRLRVGGKRVAGEPYWAATEIVVNPDLSAATVGCLLA